MSAARRGRASLAALLGMLAATVLASSCSSGDDAPPDQIDAPPTTATLGFTQMIPLEGTEHALLRVTNTSDEPLTIRSVRLDWTGYPGGEAAPESATLAPEQTLDLRFDLPAPACGPTDGEGSVTGVVETDRGVIRQPLVDTSSVYVRRLWRTQCDVATLDRAVELTFTKRWTVEEDGEGARALGAIVLERREGDRPITVASVDGSVLHGLRLPGATALPPDQDDVRIPLEITPGNRCDEHARGQATAPFDFLARLEIGDERFAVPLEVPLPAMNAATEALDLACAARAQE